MKKLFFGLMFFLLAVSPLGAAQHDYVIGNAPGVAVRTDINSALQAIVSNNAGATEPATLYPDMWWYDTSTALLKRRNNTNTAWITLGLEAADTDGTLSANSDSKIPTQKATKTYADTKASKGANSDITSITGLTTPLARSQGGLGTTAANNAANGPAFNDANGFLVGDGRNLTNLPSNNYTPGTLAEIELPTERVFSGHGVLMTAKSVRLCRSGIVTVSYTAKKASDDAGFFFNVYVDETPAGTQRDIPTSPNSSSYTTYTENITVTGGCLLSVRGNIGAGGGTDTFFVKDFSVKVTVPSATLMVFDANNP